MNRRLTMIMLFCFLLCLTGCNEEEIRYQVIVSSPTATQMTTEPANTESADKHESAQIEADVQPAMNSLDNWLNGGNWIKKTFVNQNGMRIDLNMPTPAEFPDHVFEVILKLSNDKYTSQSQVMSILGIASTDLHSNYLSIEGSHLQYSPYRRDNNEFDTSSYPLLSVLGAETEADEVSVVTDDRITGISMWKSCNVSLSKLRNIMQRSERSLKQLGIEYDSPSMVYCSQLTDGTPIIEILYPRYLEGLPMQSTTYFDAEFDPNSKDDWGHMPWDTVHFIYYWDNEKLYYCNIEHSYSEVQRNSISEPMITYTQALQSLVSSQMERFTSKQFKNQRFVVYAVRPCYVKVPVKGDTSRFIAKPAWEIAYYVTDSNSTGVYMDNFRWVTYVDARTGEVYGR